jgi:Fe-Mn family superoxide dismutase
MKKLVSFSGCGLALLLLLTTLLAVTLGQPKKYFELAPLPYAYDALEPYVDTATMKLHHDKHHQTYTDKFNEALSRLEDAGVIKMQSSTTAEEILKNFHKIRFPQPGLKNAIRNHGGGYVNHNMFWEVMRPGGSSSPTADLKLAIERDFTSYQNFAAEFVAAATAVFGSGWAWLVYNPETSKLQVISTSNQDSPLMEGLQPLLALDVWEHAYYLKYQNKRADYIGAWWNVVNWDVVKNYYDKAREQSVSGSEVKTNFIL